MQDAPVIEAVICILPLFRPGRIDAHGHPWILDRLKELIKYRAGYGRRVGPHQSTLMPAGNDRRDSSHPDHPQSNT